SAPRSTAASSRRAVSRDRSCPSIPDSCSRTFRSKYSFVVLRYTNHGGTKNTEKKNGLRAYVARDGENCYSLRDDLAGSGGDGRRDGGKWVQPSCADEAVPASGANPRPEARDKGGARQARGHSRFHARHDDALQGRGSAGAGGQ